MIRSSNLLFPAPQYPVARVRHVLPFVRGRVTTIGGVVAGIGDPLTFERDEIPPLLRPRPSRPARRRVPPGPGHAAGGRPPGRGLPTPGPGPIRPAGSPPRPT